jgi:hypothetical protein
LTEKRLVVVECEVVDVKREGLVKGCHDWKWDAAIGMVDESVDVSHSGPLLDPSENAQLYILFHLGGEAKSTPCYRMTLSRGQDEREPNPLPVLPSRAMP